MRSKGTVSLLINDAIYYPEKVVRKELETVDGVITAATKIIWYKDGGIPILLVPTNDGTWYALKDFYKLVLEHKLPDFNVYSAKIAITVNLINISTSTNEI